MIKKLFLISLATVFIVLLVPTDGGRKKSNRRANQPTQIEKRQAEAAAEAVTKRLKEEAQRRQDALPEWVASVRLIDGAEYIIQYFINENGVLTIRLEDGWHYLPKQIRLQYAQNMWSIWAKKSSPEKVDSARIKLVDKNGNKVGGSGWLGGSDVKVND